MILRLKVLTSNVPARLVDPRRFSLGSDIDGVLRDTIDELFLEPHWPKTRSLLEAICEQRVRCVNPLGAAIGDFKAWFEVLSSEEFGHLFSSQERSLLSRVVPWTRLLTRRKTRCASGEVVELDVFVRGNKDALVLKPNEGFGGFGIVLGCDVSEEQWSKELTRAMATPDRYVVQQRVANKTVDLPCLQGRSFHRVAPCYRTLSLWVMGGKFSGLLARASTVPVTNVHQNGGMMAARFWGEEDGMN